MPVERIHHINFLVRDIDAGISCYEQILGEGVFLRDDLPGRGVVTARARLGEQWLVLVQPVDPDSIPGRHLAEHGEGFFLLSFAVDDMTTATAQIEENGMAFVGTGERQGLLNWRVRDLSPASTLGAQLQLCQERDN